MAIAASVSSEQSMQVGVNGPNDVANMHVVTSIANGQLNAFAHPAHIRPAGFQVLILTT
jgi:hypothetical protein